MSEYVTRLVAKSLNQLDVIKPRLATMFEPPRLTGGPMSGLSFDVDRMADASAWGEAGSGVPAPPSRLDQHRQVEQPLADQTRLPRQTLPLMPQSSVQSPQASLRDAATSPPRQIIPTTSPQQLVEAKHEQPARQPEPVRAQPAAYRTPAATAQLASSAATRLAPKQYTTFGTVAEEESGNSLQPLIKEQSTRLPASNRHEAVTTPPAHVENPQRSPSLQAADQPTTVKAQPSMSAQLEPAVIRNVRPSPQGQVNAQPQRLRPALAERASAKQQAAPEPAPTIHVTIGRIEVRATASSAQPPARQHTAGPRMSLEEYLRQRSGGGGS